MDFEAVVSRAKSLHYEGKLPQYEGKLPQQSGDSAEPQAGLPVLCEEVYGRICNSTNSSPPVKLATSMDRKTVFIFGSDSIDSIILRHNAYDTLLRLGFDRQYIYHEVVEKKYTFWLVLFKSTAVPKETSENSEFFIVPATWDGVMHIVRTCYPKAYEDVVQHLAELKQKTVKDFEREAGFEFLAAKKNEDRQDTSAPPFYSYHYFCSLPSPRSVWQVRLFLYCEMRLLRLFKGDGYTQTESGVNGSLEYLCPNVSLSNFDPTKSCIIPMVVKIPEQ